jgi:hypothetical protein
VWSEILPNLNRRKENNGTKAREMKTEGKEMKKKINERRKGME